MANYTGITPADLFRLSNIICSAAERHACSISDAIDGLEMNVSEFAPPDAVTFARIAKRFRLSREHVLGAPLFRDPAWDMLLDLVISDADGRRLSVTALCLGSGVPATTALRHLDRLEQHGFVIRHGDGRDQRRCFIELASDCRDDLLQFLSDWVREALLPPVKPPVTPTLATASARQSHRGSLHHHPVFL